MFELRQSRAIEWRKVRLLMASTKVFDFGGHHMRSTYSQSCFSKNQWWVSAHIFEAASEHLFLIQVHTTYSTHSNLISYLRYRYWPWLFIFFLNWSKKYSMRVCPESWLGTGAEFVALSLLIFVPGNRSCCNIDLRWIYYAKSTLSIHTSKLHVCYCIWRHSIPGAITIALTLYGPSTDLSSLILTFPEINLCCILWPFKARKVNWGPNYISEKRLPKRTIQMFSK